MPTSTLRKYVDAIAVPQDQARALYRLVDVFAEENDLDRGRECAGLIRDLDMRTRAEARLALAVEPSVGRSMIADILRDGRWENVLTAIAVLEPATVLAIGADFVAVAKRRSSA